MKSNSDLACRPTEVATVPPDLSQQINEQHRLAACAARTAVEHARHCGELLIEAKSKAGHGAFLPWLEANCHVKPRQAQKYMRLAKDWPAIEAKCASDAHLTIDDALRLTYEKPIGESCANPKQDDGREAFNAWCDANTSDLSSSDRDALWRCESEIAKVEFNMVAVNDFCRTVSFCSPEDAKTEREFAGVLQTPQYQAIRAKRRAMPLGLPELENSVCYLAAGFDSWAEVTPSENHPGYFYVAVWRHMNSDHAELVNLRRPVQKEYVSAALSHACFVPITEWAELSSYQSPASSFIN